MMMLPRDHLLAAELLHAEAAAVGIAPVARRAACFLVSHDRSPEGPRRPRGLTRRITEIPCRENDQDAGGLVGRRALAVGADDLDDAHDRQVLPVAALALRILAPALLERIDLGAARLLDDLADDAGAADQRRADMVGLAVEQGEHLAEGDFRAGVAFQRHDGDLVVGGDLVLLAAGLDDCEHLSVPCSSRLYAEPRAAGFLCRF